MLPGAVINAENISATRDINFSVTTNSNPNEFHISKRLVFVCCVPVLVLIVAVIAILKSPRIQWEISLRKGTSDLQSKSGEQQTIMMAGARSLQQVVSTATSWISFLPNPEIERLADDLQQNINACSEKLGTNQTPEVRRLLRTANATVANARGRFQEALNLVTETETEDATSSALSFVNAGIRNDIVEDALAANQARAVALFGLYSWEAALKYYDRILKLDSQHHNGLGNSAIALIELHRPEQAIPRLGTLINLLRREGPAKSSSLALALSVRASASINSGNLTAANSDSADATSGYERSIAILRRLIEQGNVYVESDLALALVSRAMVYNDLGNFIDGDADCSEAKAIYDSFIAKGRVALRRNLALTLVTRSESRAGIRNYSDALSDSVHAVNIIERLVKEGRSELKSDLADALETRANLYLHLNSRAEAISDYDRSIEIYTNLISAGHRELRSSLSWALDRRGTAFAIFGISSSFAAVSADFDSALAILKALIAEGQSQYADNLALTFVDYAEAYKSFSKLNEAISACGNAMHIYERLIKEGRSDLANDLARALTTRGDAFRISRDFAKALLDLDRAVRTRQELVVKGHEHVKSSLSRSLLARAFTLNNLGEYTKAVSDAHAVIQMSADGEYVKIAEALIKDIGK